MTDIELLRRAYDLFNARDIDGLLALMRDDVAWANGMEGGHVCGRDAVRAYWTRQWAAIDPRVEPLGFTTGPEGEVVVEVHQVVRDLAGSILVDRVVSHIFHFENEVIRRFDIR